MRDGPGTPSSGKPIIADCCNVLLVLTPAEAFELDPPARITFARLGARLLTDSRNGGGQIPLATATGTMSEGIGNRTLHNHGTEPASEACWQWIPSDDEIESLLDLRTKKCSSPPRPTSMCTTFSSKTKWPPILGLESDAPYPADAEA